MFLDVSIKLLSVDLSTTKKYAWSEHNRIALSQNRQIRSLFKLKNVSMVVRTTFFELWRFRIKINPFFCKSEFPYRSIFLNDNIHVCVPFRSQHNSPTDSTWINMIRGISISENEHNERLLQDGKVEKKCRQKVKWAHVQWIRNVVKDAHALHVY